MLDLYGFVAETTTNIFMIKNGVFLHHLPMHVFGITRGLIISLCKENNIQLIEKYLVTVFYNADQVFNRVQWEN